MNRKEAIESVQMWLMDLSTMPSVENRYFARQDIPYVTWALEQILEMLKTNNSFTPEELIKCFRDDMYEFACEGGKKSKHAFSAAGYTAELALYLLY